MSTLNRSLFLTCCVFLLACAFAPSVSPRISRHQPSQIAISLPEISNVDGLIRELIAANSLQHRQALIAGNQSLISPALINGFLDLNVINPALSKESAEKVEALNRLILGLSQQLNHRKGVAVSINYLGLLYRRNRQHDLALKYHEYSLPTFQSLKENRLLARTHRYIGRVHYDQQSYPEALKHYFEEYRLAKELGESYSMALALFNLGIAYQELEQIPEAIAHHEESLKISQGIISPPPDVDLPGLIADTIFRLGSSYYAIWEYDRAAPLFQQAGELYTQQGKASELATSRCALASSQFHAVIGAADEHQYDAALNTVNDNLVKLKGDFLAIANLHGALIKSAQKKHSQALESIATAKILLKESKDSLKLRNLYRAEGIVNYAAGNLAQAQTAFDQAIKIIEEQRSRIPIRAESGPVPLNYQYSPYTWMTGVLISQGKIDDALYYAERSKSRFLYHTLKDPTGKEYRLGIQTVLQERQQVVTQFLNLEMQLAREEYSTPANSNRIVNLKSQLYQTREALVSAGAKIDSDLDDIAKRWPQEARLTRKDLASLVPNEQTALLQFVMSEDQTFPYLFVVTRTGLDVNLQAYQLKVRKRAIKKGVEQLRELITNQNQSKDLDRMGRDWYDNLLGSAQQQLKNISSWIIVPDGSLWEMPFQALKKADNHYLIESTAITYTPSFNVLRKMSQPIARAFPNHKLLALGNPALSAKKRVFTPDALMDDLLEPLPEAEKQVNWLRKYYGQQNSKVLTRNLATESSFKTLAPQFGILHLATHGLYNDLDPMRSSIVLSQTGNPTSEDGFLEAREIVQLKLQADLAILSACETGRGQVRDGEGIIGLPYALFVAGCPTTIVSQWKVNAQSTADLMVALHTKLNQTPRQFSKAEALRQAAVSLINGPKAEFRHPFYWAGFIVFGRAD